MRHPDQGHLDIGKLQRINRYISPETDIQNRNELPTKSPCSAGHPDPFLPKHPPLPSVGCANGAPGLSLFHNSVSVHTEEGVGKVRPGAHATPHTGGGGTLSNGGAVRPWEGLQLMRRGITEYSAGNTADQEYSLKRSRTEAIGVDGCRLISNGM